MAGSTVGVDREDPLVLWLLLLLSVFSVAGALVGAAFLLPETVGRLISGRALLALALTLAGAGLAMLVVVPLGRESGSARGAEPAAFDDRLLARALAVNRELDAGVAYPVAAVLVVTVGSVILRPEVTAFVVGRLEALVLGVGRPLLHAATVAFVAGAAWLALGDTGRVRLGGPDATPEYGTPGYVAMVFSAGIAAGIVFWGPAEALFHYDAVPPFVSAEPRSDAAVVGALRTTLFHWGVSAWSAYLAVALPVAYAAHNLGSRLRVSAMLVPLSGDDVVESPVGRLVDVLAVFATLGGLSTTLGFLTAQFLLGIEFRWAVSLDSTAQALFVAGMTLLVVVSVVAGCRRGMGRLSALNTVVFLGVLAAVFLLGPTLFVADTGLRALGGYLTGFLGMSLYTGETALAALPGVSGAAHGGWLDTWTTFYWAWWLSWAPFVGLFLARISRGRRIRTVVLAGGVATSAATLSWFVVVGGTTLYVQHTDRVGVLAAMAAADTGVAGYPVFEYLPAGDVLLVPFLLLILTFFVTSADAATRSLALLATTDDEPSVALRVGMAATIGVIAISLILASDAGLLQTAAVVTGGPFAVLGLVGLAGLVVTLRRETG